MVETKEITIKGEVFSVSADAGMPIRYKMLFKKYPFQDFIDLKTNDLEIFRNGNPFLFGLLYSMIKEPKEEFPKFFIEYYSHVETGTYKTIIDLFRGRDLILWPIINL